MEKSESASIFDIHPLSTHDGPGMRTALFFKGCSLNCDWCQNPESIDHRDQVWHYPINCLRCGICIDECPENALSRDNKRGIVIDYEKCTGCGRCTYICPGKALKKTGEPYSLSDTVKIVKRDKPFMTKKIGGGITVTGGEPLLQAEYIRELFIKSKSMGVHTAIDTCGHVPWESFEKVLPFTDLFLYDLKLIDNLEHKHFTGSGNHLILTNILKLSRTILEMKYTTKIWIRTPLIPGATLKKDNITGIGEFLDEEIKGNIERWELCTFNPLPKEKYDRLGLTWKYNDVPLMTRSEGEKALDWAKKSFSQTEKIFLTGLTSGE